MFALLLLLGLSFGAVTDALFGSSGVPHHHGQRHESTVHMLRSYRFEPQRVLDLGSRGAFTRVARPALRDARFFVVDTSGDLESAPNATAFASAAVAAADALPYHVYSASDAAYRPRPSPCPCMGHLPASCGREEGGGGGGSTLGLGPQTTAGEGKALRRRPRKRFDRRLEEVCRSGWGRLLSVTKAIDACACRQGDSGWA